jgi:lipoprotein-releasing system permease protein
MLFLSIRYLFSKPKQTLLTLLGIVLGTAAYVAISGMMLGFQTFIIDQLVNNDAHIKITARDEKVEIKDVAEELFPDTLVRWISPPSGRRGELNIQNVQGWMDRLREDPRVEAYSPQMRAQVIIGNGKQSISASLVGIEPEKQMLVSTIDKYMVEGKFRDIGNTGNRIIVGQLLLENLGAKVGDTILVSTSKSGPSPFRVVGKFLLGVKNIDETITKYTNLLLRFLGLRILFAIILAY